MEAQQQPDGPQKISHSRWQAANWAEKFGLNGLADKFDPSRKILNQQPNGEAPLEIIIEEPVSVESIGGQVVEHQFVPGSADQSTISEISIVDTEDTHVDTGDGIKVYRRTFKDLPDNNREVILVNAGDSELMAFVSSSDDMGRGERALSFVVQNLAGSNVDYFATTLEGVDCPIDSSIQTAFSYLGSHLNWNSYSKIEGEQRKAEIEKFSSVTTSRN